MNQNLSSVLQRAFKAFFFHQALLLLLSDSIGIRLEKKKTQCKICRCYKTNRHTVFSCHLMLCRVFKKIRYHWSRVFANGPRDRGSIPGRVIPNTLKMVLDTSLFNTQQYKVRIEGKVEQSRKRSSALPYSSYCSSY